MIFKIFCHKNGINKSSNYVEKKIFFITRSKFYILKCFWNFKTETSFQNMLENGNIKNLNIKKFNIFYEIWDNLNICNLLDC